MTGATLMAKFDQGGGCPCGLHRECGCGGTPYAQQIMKTARGRPAPTKWERRFLNLAREVSSWSKDPSTRVGAVLVRPDHTVAGIGFNGLAPGVDDSRASDREFKIASVIHAEENAILSSRDSALSECGLYVWGLAPCAHCVAVALRKGVRRFVGVQLADRPEWNRSAEFARLQCSDAGASYTVLTPADLEEAREAA